MDGPPTRFSLISLCTCAWSSPKVWNRPGKSLMANFSASPGSVGASVMRSNPKSLMTRACLSKASRKGPIVVSLEPVPDWLHTFPVPDPLQCCVVASPVFFSLCGVKSCHYESKHRIFLRRMNQKSTTLRMITSHYTYFCIKSTKQPTVRSRSLLCTVYDVTRDNAPYNAEKILSLYRIHKGYYIPHY